MEALTLKNLIINSRNNFGERKALSFYDSEGYTYNQLYSEVLKLALKLHDLGIRKGDKVAILMTEREYKRRELIRQGKLITMPEEYLEEAKVKAGAK